MVLITVPYSSQFTRAHGRRESRPPRVWVGLCGWPVSCELKVTQVALGQSIECLAQARPECPFPVATSSRWDGGCFCFCLCHYVGWSPKTFVVLNH